MFRRLQDKLKTFEFFLTSKVCIFLVTKLLLGNLKFKKLQLFGRRISCLNPEAGASRMVNSQAGAWELDVVKLGN